MTTTTHRDTYRDHTVDGEHLHVVAISGSLRRQSLNTRLLQHAQEVAPGNMQIEVISGLSALPHFNEDIETPAPLSVTQIRGHVAVADGLLLATPEYNASMSGALKNAIDWLSRPDANGTQPLPGLPTAVVGASAGPFGSIRSQLALRQVMQKTGAHVIPWPEVAVPFGDRNLEHDDFPNSTAGQLLTQLLAELGRLISRSRVATP